MHALEPAWEAIKSEFDNACARSEQSARERVVQDLNVLLRRFRQYESESEWVRLVLDGARPFADQFALFSIKNNAAELRGQVNIELPETLSFPLTAAAAFQGACSTKEPVTCLRTPGEVGVALSSASATDRAHLFPVLNDSRVAAILFVVSSADGQVDGLDLISGLASSVLERKANTALHSQIAAPLPVLVRATPSARVVPLSSWTGLPDEHRELHIRARRYSRTTIAELQLARPDACQAGREQGNLYVFVAKEIDRAREIYRSRFMTISSMVDYLHAELVQAAAEGDESKMGADYPGPLV